MSKYNLIDIFEQYRIGSGFTRDFDYAGMLKAGLETGVDTDIEILKKISDDFEDVNYHRENNHLQKAIDALEEGAIKEASMFFGDFHAEIKSTMETFDMGIPDTLGAFMDSYIKEDAKDKDKEPRDGVKSAAAKLGMKPSHVKEDTEAVDLAIEASQEKAGMEVDESFKSLAKKVDKQKGVDKEYAGKIAGKIANIKRKGGGSGPTAKQKKRMNEVRIEKEVANRIEGLMNIQLKAKFLDVFEDLWLDLIEEDPFYAEDVIAHLSNEMSKQISNRQAQGDRLAGMEESDNYVDEIGEGAMQPGEADLEAGVKGNMDAYTEGKGVDFIRALKVDANGTSMEIESYLRSLKKAGDEFDSVEDYVEDFKNYVADKALQEHFGRFMKDYQ